ncbi:MAG: IclR family transcriptional regulator [Proteobacteria bacterium]|nr:IclR family transcriptional regulator [Pseudomonadota bacterium]
MKHETVNPTGLAPPPPRAAEHGVGLLRKAFQILDLFADDRATWTQSDLVRETRLARSTLSRLVRFLCARGYLLEARGRYSLGFAAIDLGRRAQGQANLVDLCHDLLEELARTTAETAILTGYDEVRASVVCLAQIPSRHGGLRVFENIGTAYQLHAGATAKAVLAFLPERSAERVLAGPLPAVNPAVKTSAARLRRELAAIRAQGYVVTHAETYPGVTGIAVPILTPRGRPLGSIAIAGPMQRMNARTIEIGSALLVDIGRRAGERIAGAHGRQE